MTSVAAHDRALIETLLVEGYSVLSRERAQALLHFGRAIERDAIAGAVVECGVWNGGSAALLSRGAPSRTVWAFDSFIGLPEPGPHDGEASQGFGGTFCGSEARLREAFQRFAQPDRLQVVNGWFDETVPATIPFIGAIAILHVDCDWYESVKLVLEALYPSVSEGGYVVIDDYGHWPGAALATDEFRIVHSIESPLEAIDYSGRYWRIPMAER